MIIFRLFKLHKEGPDPKTNMKFYELELRDVPAFWLDKAITEISHTYGEKEKKWLGKAPLPSIPEVRFVAAKLFRRERERASGSVGYSPHGGREKLRVDRELRLMAGGPERNGLLEYCAGEMIAPMLQGITPKGGGQ